MEATKQKDAQGGARNKTEDDAIMEEGVARSGVCLKERDK